MTEITQYARWRKLMGWTHDKAAQELEISTSQSKNYEQGIDRGTGNPSRPPKSIRVHMRTLADNLDVKP